MYICGGIYDLMIQSQTTVQCSVLPNYTENIKYSKLKEITIPNPRGEILDR